jgi:anti-anti-sigma factor
LREFKLTEIDRRATCRELRIEGDLDGAVSHELGAALDRAAGCMEVWIDLRECDFIDSTALAIFVNAHREMSEVGRRLFLYHPRAQVARLLDLTGLNRDGLIVHDPGLG